MRFHTTIYMPPGKNVTGILVPPEVVAALGTSKKPAVTVTLNGFTYRSSIASMGGLYLISLSSERRASAGVEGGDEVDVDIELDETPREVTVPADLAAALAAAPGAPAAFEKLSYSNQLRHVLSVEDAKTPETRARRLEKVVAALQ